eukprot:5959672-Amphidinium_carterae.1
MSPTSSSGVGSVRWAGTPSLWHSEASRSAVLRWCAHKPLLLDALWLKTQTLSTSSRFKNRLGDSKIACELAILIK